MSLDLRYNIAHWVEVLTEQEFIKDSYKYCELKGASESNIVWLWKLGNDYNKLTITFEQFSNHLSGRSEPWFGPQRSYYCRWEIKCPFREGFSYRKNVDHKKKQKKQDEKLLWRKVSGIDKDKRKKNSWESNRRQSARKAGSAAFRQFSKRMIAKGRYDELAMDSSDWKLFNDPWSWN